MVREHPVPRGEALHLVPDVRDDPHGLVTQNGRRGGVFPAELLQVRAAQAAGPHLHEEVSPLQRGDGDLLHIDLPFPGEHRGLHDAVGRAAPP